MFIKKVLMSILLTLSFSSILNALTYQECVDNGGTDIGCKVGIHKASSLYLNDNNTSTWGYAGDIAVKDNYAFIPYGNVGLRVVDISNPIKPSIAGNLDFNGKWINNITVSNNYGFVYNYDSNLTIIDISNPTNPSIVTSYETVNNSITDVAVNGDIMYVTSGIIDYSDENVTESSVLEIVDINDTSNLVKLSSLDIDGYIRSITVDGDYAYLSLGQNGLKIVNISDPTNPAVVSSLSIESGYVTDVAIKGNYAFLADVNNYIKVVDISDSSNPNIIKTINGLAFKFKVKGNYLYGGNSAGLVVIDINDSANPTILGTFGINAQNMDIIGNYAFIADGSEITTLDISNPSLNYSLINKLDGVTKGNGLAINNNIAYMITYSDFNTLDISDINNLNYIGATNLGNDFLHKVKVKDNKAYTLSTSWDNYVVGKLHIIDVNDSSNPQNIINFELNGSEPADLEIKDNFAYIVSNSFDENGSNGLIEIVDINDSSNPIEVVNYDINNTYLTDIQIVNNNAYIIGNNGLKIFDINNSSNPVLVGEYNSTNWINCVLVEDSYAYIPERGISIIDVSDPSNPIQVNQINANFGNISSIVKVDNYLYVVSDYTISIVDISDLSNPIIKGTININGYGASLVVIDNYAYIADYEGFKVVDIQKAIERYQLLDDVYHFSQNNNGNEENDDEDEKPLRGDFNGDGITDVLVQRKSDGNLYTLIMDSNGTSATLNKVASHLSIDNWIVMNVADFNADGNTDVLLYRKSDGNIYTLIMNSNGTSATLNKVANHLSSDSWKLINIDDFSGDGRADVALQRITDGNVYILVMNSDGTDATLNKIASHLDSDSWKFINTADYNGDGAIDILTQRKSDGNLYTLIMNNDASSATLNKIASHLSEDNWWVGEDIADFNGDGNADVVVARDNGDLFALITSNGGTSADFIKLASGIAGDDWSGITVADFNGDGKSDILLRRNTDGNIYTLITNSNASGATLNKIASHLNRDTWYIADVAGDFNGDGIADALAVRKTDGNFYTLIMNSDGTSATLSKIANHLTHDAWEPQNLADYSGDGIADILIQRITDGNIYILVTSSDGTNATLNKVANHLSNDNWIIY